MLNKTIQAIRELDKDIILDTKKLSDWFLLNRIHGLTWKYIHNKKEGVYISQIYTEFAKHINYVIQERPKTYLEIGLFKGGAFIVFVEIMQRFGLEKAYGVDIKLQSLIKQYAEINKNVEIKELDTKSKEFDRFLEGKRIDFIFIDGDHSFEGCFNDFNKVKNHTDKIAFHDICSFDGVRKVYNNVFYYGFNKTCEIDDGFLENRLGIGYVKKW